MKPPLKLSAIEQEHLQELYEAAGVARDELPYSEAFTKLVEDFQDRTFKNGEPEQVYGALLKYTRTGSLTPTGNGAADLPLTDEQLKLLKGMLARHATGGKVLPYSDAFNAARTEFIKASKVELTELQFWQAVIKTVGAKRRPPPPRKKAKADEDDE